MSDSYWQDQAACKGRPEWFVGELSNWEELRAKDICARCPVRELCQDFGDFLETENPETKHPPSDWQCIWGGETPVERRIRRGVQLYIKPVNRRKQPKPLVCGSTAMYREHQKRKEKPCFECSEAKRYAERARKARKGTMLANHGTPTRWRQKCKCDRCHDAILNYERERRRMRRLKNLKHATITCKVCDKAFLWTGRAGHRPTLCPDCKAAGRKWAYGDVRCRICNAPFKNEIGIRNHTAVKHRRERSD